MATHGVIFDAYGTLLDVHSAMLRHADRIGEAWTDVSAAWRIKQLEYSWISSMANPAHHEDFGVLTDRALDFVATKFGLTDAALLADLRAAYRELSAYPDAADALKSIRAQGIPIAILSNGEPKMLQQGVQAAGLESLLDEVLSIESVGIYKPDPRVYAYCINRFGGDASKLVFVSSNAWDAYGALCAGFRVIWMNRTGQPDEYGLRANATELSSLSELPAVLA
jgi:2-haloacid dehalogenase